jgi:hypothetical protein
MCPRTRARASSIATVDRDAWATSKPDSPHRTQHPPPLEGERRGCGDGLCSSVRGRSSAWNRMTLPGGGVLCPSSFVVTARPALTACPESARRPSRMRSRRRASPKPWRTDSTLAVSCASPRTEHGVGAACATPRPQQNARPASGAAHNRRAPSSRPWRATASAPTKASPERIGPAAGCHCAPTNKPLNHAAAIQGSTHPAGAKCVPAPKLRGLGRNGGPSMTSANGRVAARHRRLR